MRFIFRAALAVFSWAVLAISPAAAAPVQWLIADGGNDHYYDFITGNISWTAALTDAQGRSHAGLQGTLATITSEAEKEFVRLHVVNARGWLGGFQNTASPDYSEPAGGWQWVSGEAWNYTHWASFEPNEAESGENYLEIDPASSSPDHFAWNDQQIVEHFNTGYYIEYATPEPATWLMLLLGAAGIGCISRRGRR